MIRLGAHRCADPMTRRTAFTFLVPHGWRASSEVRWNGQSLLNPVTPTATAQAPDGSAWLALFPNGAFSWVDGGRRAEGSLDFGVPILRPRPAAEMVATVLFPSVRPGVADLRVVRVEAEPAPPWPSHRQRTVAPGDDSVRVTLEYTMGGRAFREIVALVSRVDAPTPLPTMWGVEHLRYWFTFPALSVGAALDRWDEHAPTLDALRRTFRVEPDWITALETVFRQLAGNALDQQQAWFAAQQAAHRAQVAWGDQLVQQGRELSAAADAAVVGGWEQRERTYDRVYDDQYLATMGVARYDDPAQPVPVELPYGYDSVWSDGQGDYVLSEDPSYDPNVGAGPGPTWQRLRKAD
ncbi:hypothetical protein ACFYTQ_06350 [Nocardia sp. NPDC004068]|uniref:hypothetical protein n=1 Tax=Nocardia sp. NPDC004068 TaxID=3364303 RepID=UPI0036AE46FB